MLILAPTKLVKSTRAPSIAKVDVLETVLWWENLGFSFRNLFTIPKMVLCQNFVFVLTKQCQEPCIGQCHCKPMVGAWGGGEGLGAAWGPFCTPAAVGGGGVRWWQQPGWDEIDMEVLVVKN